MKIYVALLVMGLNCRMIWKGRRHGSITYFIICGPSTRKSMAGRNKLFSGSLDGRVHTNPNISPRTCKGSEKSNYHSDNCNNGYNRSNWGFLPDTGNRIESSPSSVPEISSFLTGGGHYCTASNMKTRKGSKQVINYYDSLNKNKSVYKGKLLPFAAQRQDLPSSSVPESYQHLFHKEDHMNIKRSDGSYYESPLNGQIYHLSVWCKGESSYTHLEPDSEDLKHSHKDRLDYSPDLAKRRDFSSHLRGGRETSNQISDYSTDLASKARWGKENRIWKPP